MRKLAGFYLLLVGCGGSSELPSRPDGGADAAALPSPCPAAAPQAGESCPRIGLTCEYGDDPRNECHVMASCEANGMWLLTAPRCTPLPGVTCPATREAAAGQDCTPMDAWCVYGDLECHCTNCREFPVAFCGGPLLWKCDEPNADPACPAGKPLLGAGCRPDGKVCTYSCGQDGGRTCTGGAWQASEGGPCPISTRRAKRDISYLDPHQIAAIARAVEATRLATWEYTDPALGPGRRLGFIIEDQPPGSPAVEPDRQMVNEYGYTSMLLAALQAQRREIEELRRKLDALEKAVRQRTKR